MNAELMTIAVDIGGTNISAAVLESSRITRRTKRSTEAQRGVEAVVTRIKEAIEELLSTKEFAQEAVAGIGLSVPGQIDRRHGMIISTPNIGFNNYPIAADLKEHFQLPIFLENDVNAGTYGEFLAGAGKGYRNLVGVFPGTGIGGSIIIDGKLYRGTTGNAGEVGHMIIREGGPLCNCGQYGCLEALSGRISMAKDAVALAGSGKAPSTFERAGTDFKNYKSKVFERAYKDQEHDIIRIVERAAYFLGIGIANLVNVLDPEIVIIGGGIIDRLGRRYLRLIEKSVREHALPVVGDAVRIAEAQLKDDAVLIGTAGLLAEMYE